MEKHVVLHDLEIYQLAMEVGELVWEKVDDWSWLPQKTVGAQWISAVDSIAANIAEGYGRYFYKERRQFFYFSRGSLLETKTWAQKAHNRSLVSSHDFDQIIEKLQVLHYKINIYLKKLRNNSSGNSTPPIS